MRTLKKIQVYQKYVLLVEALNCVANGKILKERIFDEIWIQPKCDAGTSIGGALVAHYEYFKNKRKISMNDSMRGHSRTKL